MAAKYAIDYNEVKNSNYNEAVVKFKEIENYSDSREQINRIKQGRYEEANKYISG